MNEFATLLPLYQAELGSGQLAAVRPLDPHLPLTSLTESLHRYLRGDVHELDLDVAESIRAFARVRCLASNKPSPVGHFCAAVLLTHLFHLHGAGFGHTEAPLLIAINAVRSDESWRLPSAIFLQAMYEKHARQQIGALAAYVGAAALVLNEVVKGQDTLTLTQSVLADADRAQFEPNEDRCTQQLLDALAFDIRRLQVALPEHVSVLLHRLNVR